jgi:GTPase SAR1 family protein
MTNIIINLSESSDAKVFAAENIVHIKEYDRAKIIIDERIATANKLNKSNVKSFPRENNTISILGSRGSGKTSFLRTLLASYKKNNDIIVLNIVDPTLIEDKGHIFLTIISLIQEKIDEILEYNACKPTDAHYGDRKTWNEKLRKLANGLPSMDGIGSSMEHPDWQDSEYIMNKGLNSVKSAFDLEYNFNELLNYSLKILGKDALILALDDIDVDFRKGWPVLETIRKYLTSPQLIILLSGDLKLYSKAVRKQQWKNFGKALLKNEAEHLLKMESYNDLVTEMESQYMQKVIKPENRIVLTSLLEKIMLQEITIQVLRSNDKENHSIYVIKKDEENKDKSEIAYYDLILQNFGICNKYQQEAYRTFLLSQPVRTQIQFFKQFEKNGDVSDAFLSELYEKGIDVDMARNIPKMLNILILNLLLKEKNLQESYQLQPTTSDSVFNSAAMALSFLYSQKVKNNSFLIFDYFIRIGYVRNILSVLGFAENEKDAASMYRPTVEGLCNYSGILQDKVLRDVVGNMTTYIQSTLKSTETPNGNVYLYGFSKKQKESNEEAIGKIDFELKAESSLVQRLAFLPLVVSQNLINNSSIISFSIYSLLGTISELIRKAELKDLDRGIMELSQIRSYPMYAFDKSISNNNEISTYNEFEFTSDNEMDFIVSYFEIWLKAFPNRKISPHILGKILTRIYYAMLAIDSENNIDINYAEAIHRRIVAVMNAILIEDVREHDPLCNYLNINNAISSDTILRNNLRQVVAKMDDNDFFLSKWLLSCPLFLFYLNPELLRNDYLSRYTFLKINKGEQMAYNQEIFIDHFDSKLIDSVFTNKKSIYEILSRIAITIRDNQSVTDKPTFSGSESFIAKTIEVLAKKMTRDEFLNSQYNDFSKKYADEFLNGISKRSYSALKNHLNKPKNKIKWR